MYILLTGYAKAGKNTVADMMENRLKQIYPDKEIRQESLAEPIKDVMDIVLKPYSAKETKEDRKMLYFTILGDTGRAFLQWFGTEVMQKAFHKRFKQSTVEKNTFWCSHLYQRSRGFVDYTIVTDVRFPHEIEYFKNAAGEDNVIVIYVDNGVRKNWWERMKSHKSERYAEKLAWDIRIRNEDRSLEGMIALKERVHEIVGSYFSNEAIYWAFKGAMGANK